MLFYFYSVKKQITSKLNFIYRVRCFLIAMLPCAYLTPVIWCWILIIFKTAPPSSYILMWCVFPFYYKIFQCARKHFILFASYFFHHIKTPDSKGWNSGVVHTNGVEQNARWDRSASLVATEQSSCDI